MKTSNYTVAIIGSGISGLYAALKLEQELDKNQKVVLITKSSLSDSNSYYAQGGMVAVLNENENDSVESHISDTLKAGAGLSELNTVKFISENSDKVVKDLLTFGVEFDRDENGNFTLTREAAHSVRRILHAGGDATGREMESALCKAVKLNKNISIFEDTMAVDLIVKDGICKGLIAYNSETDEYEAIFASATILACGGLGQLYRCTTNPIGATGDGFALAYRAGAELQDMEFVQFHPTALAYDEGENRFLISEAVRGEGATLCDEFGFEFMAKYNEKRELAPRDVVARSIYCEMNNNGDDYVYLNATSLGKDKILKRFPTIYRKCKEYGIDMAEDFIPVAPAAHYFMGGVKTNLNGQTSLAGLYAIGEVSSTGLHGANRLASNSLLECVVCAYSVSKYLISQEFTTINLSDYDIINIYDEKCENKSQDIIELKSKIQNTMWTNVGIFRIESMLNTASRDLVELKNKFNKEYKCNSKSEYELRNMLLVAQLVVNCAINRRESRGAHYRIDYLNTEEVSKHSIVTNKKGEVSFVK